MTIVQRVVVNEINEARDLYGADCDELLSENAEPAMQNIRPLPTPQLDASIKAVTA